MFLAPVLALVVRIETPVEWDFVLARLASNPRAFQRIFRGGRPRDKSIGAWVKKSGLAWSVKEFNELYRDGGIQVPAAIPILGSPGDAVVLLQKADGPDRRYPEGSCLALFRKRGNRLYPSILESTNELYDALALPQQAAMAGNSLFVSALMNWSGNGESMTFKAFRRESRGWTRVGDEPAVSQCYETPPFRLSPDGKSVLPMVVSGYTYPGWMSACHAAARYHIEQKWIFSGGIAKPQWDRPANTAFNTLDELLCAARTGDKDSARRFCLNERIFKALWKLRPALIHEILNPVLLGADADSEPNPVGFDSIGKSFRFQKVDGHWLLARLTPWHEVREP